MKALGFSETSVDLQKLRWEAWTGLVWLWKGTGGGQGVRNIRVPYNVGNFLTN